VQVTALETVFPDGPNKVNSCVLSEHLMCFCGILAAGTRCGHIYLIGTFCHITCASKVGELEGSTVMQCKSMHCSAMKLKKLHSKPL